MCPQLYQCALSQWGGTRWRSWLRHCTTNRNVAGSIPEGVTGIFHLHNRSGRTMALGSTQPLTEMSTNGGKGGRCVGLTTLPTSCADCLKNLEASTSWNPNGLSRPVMGLLYLYLSKGVWDRNMRTDRQTDMSVLVVKRPLNTLNAKVAPTAVPIYLNQRIRRNKTGKSTWNNMARSLLQ
jgi:hypothetical protein